MEQQINDILNICREYSSMNTLDPNRLNELLKDLSGRLFYLETLRSDIHDKWQSKVFELTKEGHTVSRAENEAHTKYPEMYLLRRVVTSGWKVSDAIRTNISYLKNEVNGSV